MMYFNHALVRTPASTLATGLTTRELGKPDLERTLQQHQAYIAALTQCGVSVHTLPPEPDFPDGHFVEDVAVIYQDMAFITRPGAPARRAEIDLIQAALPQSHKIELTGDDAFLEGGDVLYCADNHVLIGLSTRTNQAGAEQLKTAIESVNPSATVIFIPIDGVLHLKTGLTELAPGVMLKSPLMQADLDFATVIELPEAEEYGCNIIPVNGSVLIAEGFPTVKQIAEEHYDKVVEVPMTEFEKMDGSLTCLSLRYSIG